MRTVLLYTALFISLDVAVAQNYDCFDADSPNRYAFTVDSIEIEVPDGIMHAYLYQPEGNGPFPAAITMHGGGNNYSNIMNVPLYFSKRAAGCGIIALAYDKRGTGRSTLDYSSADFNDFVSDASSAIDFLNALPNVDSDHIAAFGVSQGGRLVGVLAARNTNVDMIANVSGPINSVVLTRKFSTLNSIRNSNASQELLTVITPYWERHFDLLDAEDRAGLQKLDAEIVELRKKYNPNWLPSLSTEIRKHPIENSFGLNFFDEYEAVTIPWLNIFGENDRIVDAKTSVRNLEKIRANSGNSQIEIILRPNSAHSLYDTVEEKQYPFDDEVVKWILSKSKEN